MTLFDADIKPDPALGEDTWELFEVIEDSFGVDLGDYHAYLGMTVKEVAEEVCKRANYPPKDKCMSAVSFYRLRRDFERLFDVPRTTIRPSTLLTELLPWESRNRRWRILQSKVGLEIPGLVYPRWLLYLAVLTPAIFLICLRVFWGFQVSAVGMFGGAILLIVPSLIAFSPFARNLPPGCETVGGLAKVILARNYAVFASQHGNSDSDVLSALRQLVATQLLMNKEKVFPETRIPDGLNIY